MNVGNFKPRWFNSSTLAFAGLGIIALVAYAFFNFVIPQTAPYMESPRALLIDRFWAWGAITRLPISPPGTASEAVGLLFAATLILIACYFAALYLSKRVTISPAVIAVAFGLATLFWLTSVLALPNFSSDLYIYILYARLASVFQASPYVYSPADFDLPSNLQLAGWTHTTTPYGPAWTYLSTGWSYLAGDDIAVNVIVFRVFLFAACLANAVLIWKILGRVNPSYRLPGLIFYAWNPIVVLKGMGHVETVMLFFVLLGLYLYLRQREWAALIILVVSALTKYVTAPLLIVYLIFMWRRTPRSSVIAGTAGLVALVTLAFYLPVWDAWNITALLVGQAFSSLAGIVLVLLFVPVLVWVTRRELVGTNNLLESWAIVSLATTIFLMVGHPAYAWYVIPLVGVASIAATPRVGAMTLALCASALFANVLGGIATSYIELPQGYVFAFFWRVLLWFVPPLLALLWVERAQLPRLLRKRQAFAK